MTNAKYPFAALVGQEPLKTALLLNAVDPGLGGVLICGEKGTAKSTAARALAALLPPISRVKGCPFQCPGPASWPDCPYCQTANEPALEEAAVPFVDLPLGATEDRVLGSLDFERALREGRRAFHPGLLATAHRGILYIDEVNLLPDHLVDVLLDVAAMGVNIVQREGIEVRHPSRFILIGTMNPEEGELRPQFLDRFGLMVMVAGPREPATRSEIVRRRLAFESNAAGFAQRWSGEQADLRSHIVQARGRLPAIEHDDATVSFISQLCCEMQVAGMRSDIVLLKTARTLAAWQDRSQVSLEDVRSAAELVLPHRRRRRPFEKPGLDRQQLDKQFPQKPQSEVDQPALKSGTETGSPVEKDIEKKGSQADSPREVVFAPAPPATPPRIEMTHSAAKLASPGRRNATSTPGRGAFVRSSSDPAATDIAIDATIRLAVQHGPGPNGGVQVLPEDLHRKERMGRAGTLLLFVVDGSGSMAAKRRMQAVKGAVLGLLQSAYEQRDHLAVISFRGPLAELLLPATRSVAAAEQVLASLPTGGRTPLSHALVLARELIERTRRTQPGLPVLLILLTDGKANVCLPGSAGDAWQQALEAVRALQGIPALVFDTETGIVRSGRSRLLADALGAECLALEDLAAENLLVKIRERFSPLTV